MSNEFEDEWQQEDEVVASPAKPTLQEPSKYCVLMLNDDYTPMDFVIEVLEGLFSMQPENAKLTMMKVHTEGLAKCGIYPFEIAEAKVEQANSYSQQHGHPLQCTMEEA
ncbi:MAG TPA: ATP-dependent Clp protease adapter ClpS [Gammaproteobacteria bacterium]|nr:ATP-dependent Clp protease adapter ClpS [Gammaproteobacteria bacterium]